MTEYIKFELTPGQMAPEGNTGICLSDGYIVWTGDVDTFEERAFFGRLTPQDPTPETTVTNYTMTQDEIDEYLAMTTISGAE